MTLDWSNVTNSMQKTFELKKNKVHKISKNPQPNDSKNYPSVLGFRNFINDNLDNKQDQLISSTTNQNFRQINGIDMIGKGNVTVLTEHQPLDDYYKKSYFEKKFINIVEGLKNNYSEVVGDFNGHTSDKWVNDGYTIDESKDFITALKANSGVNLYYLNELVDLNKGWVISFKYYYDNTYRIPSNIEKQKILLDTNNSFSIRELFEKALYSNVESCIFTLKGSTTEEGFSNVTIQVNESEPHDLCTLTSDFRFTFETTDVTDEDYLIFNDFNFYYIIEKGYKFVNYETLPETGEKGVIYLYDCGKDGIYNIYYWLEEEERYTQIGKTNHNLPYLVLKEDIEARKLVDETGHYSCWTKQELNVNKYGVWTSLKSKSSGAIGKYTNDFNLNSKDTWNMDFDYLYSAGADLSKQSIQFGGNEYTFEAIFENVELKDQETYNVRFLKHVIDINKIVVTISKDSSDLSSKVFDFVEFDEYLFSFKIKDTEKPFRFKDLYVEFMEIFPISDKKQDLLIDSGTVGKNLKRIAIGGNKYSFIRALNDMDETIRINTKQQEEYDWNETNESEKSFIKNKPETFLISDDLINDSDYIIVNDLEKDYYKKISFDDKVDKRIYEIGVFKVFLEKNNVTACTDNSLTLLFKDNYYDIYFAIGKNNTIPVPLGSTRNKSLLTTVVYSADNLSDKYLRLDTEEQKVLSSNDFTDDYKSKLDVYKNMKPYKFSKEFVDMQNSIDDTVKKEDFVNNWGGIKDLTDKYPNVLGFEKICKFYADKILLEGT